MPDLIPAEPYPIQTVRSTEGVYHVHAYARVSA